MAHCHQGYKHAIRMYDRLTRNIINPSKTIKSMRTHPKFVTELSWQMSYLRLPHCRPFIAKPSKKYHSIISARITCLPHFQCAFVVSGNHLS